jgi:hypothetical protein
VKSPSAAIALALAPAAFVIIASLPSQFIGAAQEQARPSLAQCRTISATHDRLARYDRLEGKPFALPAKGGQAAALAKQDDAAGQ